MRKFPKSYIAAFAVLWTIGATARGGDTLHTFNIPTEQELRQLDRLMAVPTGIRLLPRAGFSYNTVSYGRESGKMRRVQMPEKATNVRLRSIGLHTADTWQLYGEFAYARLYEDSVQWLLSEMPVDGLPYYFGSPKKGNWEREQYDLKGTFSWNINQRFVAGAAAQIRYQKGTRSNDPRPSTESFTSRYYLFGGLTLPRFSAIVSGGLGYGTRDNDFVYNNPDNDRGERLDLMAYELMGFGINRKTQQFQNRSLESNVYTRYAGLQLQGRLDSLVLWARIGYDMRRDSIRRSRTTNVSRSLLSTYHVNKWTIEAGANYTFNPSLRLQTQAYACLSKGYDKLYNILQGQKNYIYQHRNMGVEALLFQYGKKQAIRQYAFSAGYEFEKKHDGSTQHIFERKAFDVSIAWHRQCALRSSYYIFYGLKQAFTFPTATLSYPSSQENIFSTDLATPLCNYYHTRQGLTGLNVGAGKTFGRYGLFLSLDYKMAYALARTYGIEGQRHRFKANVILGF